LGNGATLGYAAALADSGRAGEVAAGVGRVRRLAFSFLPSIFWQEWYGVLLIAWIFKFSPRWA